MCHYNRASHFWPTIIKADKLACIFGFLLLFVFILSFIFAQGPGSQQQKNPFEADANFGTVVEGMDDVVPRIHSVPQDGWLDKENQINIIRKTILIPDGQGGFKPWLDSTKDILKEETA